MAVFYVSTAGDDTNGTTWEKAWNTLAQANAVAAGSEVWVSSVHDEAVVIGDFTGGTRTAPIKIISALVSDDSYVSRGAKFQPAAGRVEGSVHLYGLEIGSTGADYDFMTDPIEDQTIEDCLINVGNGVGDDLLIAGAGELKVVNCQLDLFDQVTSSVADGAIIHFLDCNIVKAGAAVRTQLIKNIETRSKWTLEGCDLTDWDEVCLAMEHSSILIVKDCQMKSGFDPLTDMFTGTISDNCHIYNIGSTGGTGISTRPLGLQYYENMRGTVVKDLTRRRTGGADDGLQANAYSWLMTTNANALEFFLPLKIPFPLTRFIDPDGTPSGTTLGLYATTRAANPQASATNLTTDGDSTWVGSGVGTKQKITHTLNSDDGTTLTVYVASGVTLTDKEFWVEIVEPDSFGGPIQV